MIRYQGITKNGAHGTLLNFLLYLKFGISIKIRCQKSPLSVIPKPLVVIIIADSKK